MDPVQLPQIGMRFGRHSSPPPHMFFMHLPFSPRERRVRRRSSRFIFNGLRELVLRCDSFLELSVSHGHFFNLFLGENQRNGYIGLMLWCAHVIASSLSISPLISNMLKSDMTLQSTCSRCSIRRRWVISALWCRKSMVAYRLVVGGCLWHLPFVCWWCGSSCSS